MPVREILVFIVYAQAFLNMHACANEERSGSMLDSRVRASPEALRWVLE